MSQNYWMDDTPSQNSWYSPATTGAASGGQSATTNDGWGAFDYGGNTHSSPYDQQAQHAAPPSYYGGQPPQQQQYRSQGDANGGYYGGGQMFIPSQYDPHMAGGVAAGRDASGAFDDERPLLEELGINFDHIRQKTLAVLNPVGTASATVIADQDLAGPLVFCLLFGVALLLHGKIHFGYIYGIGVLGCLGMYSLLNLMGSADAGISLTCTVSVLGYCLLPMALLSLLAAVLSFQGMIGLAMSALAVLWASMSSSKLFVIALSLDSQRLLVAYPCVLLYGVFALLAIF